VNTQIFQDARLFTPVDANGRTNPTRKDAFVMALRFELAT